MYYTIYRITNQINGKCYIGKHQTNNLEDGYMGSGKLIKRAIAKYGIENFTKEILHIFDSEAEMNAKEAEIVTEEFCKNNYNLCNGGQGGFSYINKTIDHTARNRKISAARDYHDPKYKEKLLAARKIIVNKPEFKQRQRELWLSRGFNGHKGSENQAAKSVKDDQHRIFGTLKEYATFYGITQNGATRRLKKGINCYLMDL